MKILNARFVGPPVLIPVTNALLVGFFLQTHIKAREPARRFAAEAASPCLRKPLLVLP